MRTLLRLAALAMMTTTAQAADISVKLGVLTDMSGPYASLSGEGSAIAARMAADEFMKSHPGIKVTVVAADHQNKPDVGSALARKWFDQDDVDAIVDSANSGVALAVSQIVAASNKVFLASGPATSDLTGKSCSPNTIHWTYDTYALSHGTGGALTRAGGDKWFFITADYAFGHALERDTASVVEENGGKVLGKVRAPLNSADFSSYLLQAQTSGANVVGLANAGADVVAAIKQAHEFGLDKSGARLAGLLLFITDIKSLGLNTAQGLVLSEAFYWDLNDATRGFSKRFAERAGGRMPSALHAGAYSATTHYLKAIAAIKSKASLAVIAQMKATPTDDEAFGKGWVRKDGREMNNMYLFQVKKPSESKGEWDLYKVLATIPAEQAFRPIDKGDCPLVR